MKRVLIALPLLSLVVLPAPGEAAERSVRLWASFGRASALQGATTDNGGTSLGFLYNPGQSVAGGVAYGLGQWVGILAEIEWNRLAFKEDNGYSFSHPSIHGHVDEGEPAHIVSGALSLQLILSRSRTVTPFIVLGGGASRVSYTVTEHDEESVPAFVDPTGVRRTTRRIAFSETPFALGVGLGVDVARGRKVGLSADWRYHRPFTSPSQYMAERLFIESTSYHSARAGVSVRVH